MATLGKMVEFLDKELEIEKFEDSSHNGLQVENSGRVKRACFGVDASLEFFEAAAKKGADLVVCHHGISWADSLKRITGLNYGRLRFLIENDIALYACHLPLDAHARYGNNALICKALGLRSIKPFGLYKGALIGFEGKLPKPVRYEAFKKRVARAVGRELQCMDFGRKTVCTVAVVSGGGSGELDEAGLKGIDVFVTGEPTLSVYSQAQEHGINALFGGHYATEVFGVRALVDVVKKRFGIPCEFVDLGVEF